MGVRVGRGVRGRRPRKGNDEHVNDFNGQGNDQGIGANGDVEGVNGNVEGANRGAPDFSMIIAQQLQNLLLAMLAQIRTLSREVTVSMSWNDFKFMMIEEFCPSHKMQKLEIELWNHVIVKICEMVAATEPKTMQMAVQIFGALTNEAVRNGSIKKVEKRGNDYRRVPRNVNPVNARNPPVRACYECGSTDHVRSACPRWNREQGTGGNRPNQVVANNEGQGHGNQMNQARGRAFMLGAEEARKDPNIVAGLRRGVTLFCHDVREGGDE
nr:hypothetical protein [Tanacetum cinerariifolium]